MIENELKFIFGFFSFGLGATIASFLNVVIYRVPRGESIVSPPSHCPKCDAKIKWYQNVPIFSWLALRGKCAACKAPISPRYILIELLGASLFLATFLHFVHGGVPLSAMFIYWSWIALMIVGTFIDFDHHLLPDFVTIGGMVLGVAVAVIETIMLSFSIPHPSSLIPLINSLSGLIFGFGLLWLIRFFGSKAFKREAMGEGDVYLMGAVGALFGPIAVLVTLILSSVFGSVLGVGMIILSKTKFRRFIEIPYGPYICLGCLVWMFYGPQLVDWYITLMRGV